MNLCSMTNKKNAHDRKIPKYSSIVVFEKRIVCIADDAYIFRENAILLCEK